MKMMLLHLHRMGFPILLHYLAVIVIVVEMIGGVGGHKHNINNNNNNNSSGEEVIRCIERERQALLQFKASLVDNSGMLSSWTTQHDDDCCLWERVQCSNQTGHVIMLDLHGDMDAYFIPPALQGNINSSLMVLQSLVHFDLSYNLNGFQDSPIPEFLGSLINLRYLDLSFCGFRGNIPSQLGSLSQLRYLNLGYNSLEGSIPYQLGNLSYLQHLDLEDDNLVGAIPYQLGNLSHLQYLDLTWNPLVGVIPYQLGNLFNLQELQLGFSHSLKIGQDTGNGGEWLSSLTSLTHLSLNNITDLKHSHKWLQMIANLSNLRELNLQDNDLSDHHILSLRTPGHQFNSLDSLSVLDLSFNNFTSSMIFQWFASVTPNLVQLNLKGNHLQGGLGLKSLGDICTLRELYFVYNQLSEDLPTIFQCLSGCARFSLQELDLSYNQIIGPLIDLSNFTSLETLDISHNRLNGTIPDDLQFPPQLVTLSVSSNSLKGVLSDYHFANVPNLKSLSLDNNSMLALRFNKGWIPPFQLEYMSLGSCMLGPSFPKWLQTQNSFIYLGLSNAQISDIIPEGFWHTLSPNLSVLDLSYNDLWGTIPNFPIQFTSTYPLRISLASNRLEGQIPEFLHHASYVNLTKNNFSKCHMFLCAKIANNMVGLIDLSNNQLSGQLPDCWSQFNSLVYLDLSSNNLTGSIPASFGDLHNLKFLILRKNMFSGLLPSLKNCSKLEMLDVGENRLLGPIPSWIGMGLLKLRFLILRKNHLSGSIPFNLCYVTSIQFLDLSFNNLVGQLPKCFQNFTTMANETIQSTSVDDNYYTGQSDYFIDYGVIALLMWKGAEQMFKKNVFFLKGIDLSCNQLTGEIPVELCNLVGLDSLNLSRNHLTGEIPSDIGRLELLDFLDLSRNHLIGSIPSSLAQIYRISVLDLSHNNLSGKIPISTQLQSFNSSAYEDNLDLCGKPLEKVCPDEDEKPQEKFRVQEEDEDLLFSKGFYWSMALGFVVGFCGIFGSILFNRSWRHLYFMFLNNLADTTYVMLIVNVNKCKRWLNGYLEKLT